MVASQGIRTGSQDVAFLTDLGTYGSLSTEDARDYYLEVPEANRCQFTNGCDYWPWPYASHEA
ncbi:MAG: hypothetical protein R3B91_16080 [Planctomycetaceae bacterium]